MVEADHMKQRRTQPKTDTNPAKTERKLPMATLATPKKHPYILQQGKTAAFERSVSTKREIHEMKRRAELFSQNNLKNGAKND
jgi:hypothetical protein